jgi:hypothetical protein
MSEINVEVQIIKDIPEDKIKDYVDLTIFGIARGVLDYTLSDNRFPQLTGNLMRSAMAEGVKKESENTYYVGAEGADYATYVWGMPQNTNWTNPDTYAQWYEKVYKEKVNIITQQAVDNAIRSVK